MADYTLSESDVTELKALMAMSRNQRSNPTLRPSLLPIEDAEHQSPEVYVAKTPPGGIAPLVVGSPFVSCTGTGTAGNTDKPGKAWCCLYSPYQVIEPGTACLDVVWQAVPGGSAAVSATVHIPKPPPTGTEPPDPCPTSPGSGYQIGDLLFLNGGEFTTSASFTVTALGNNNSVESVALDGGGLYQTIPINPVPTTTLTFKLVSMKGPQRLVHNFATQAIPGGVWILVQRDKAGTWWVVQAGGGGVNRQLVQLYKKTYTLGQWTRYDWKFAADVMPSGVAIDGVGQIPAYHIDNQISPGVDLPVPLNVYVNASAVTGAYLLIETMPEWDFCRKTGAASGGYFPGYRVRYRQDTGLVKDMYQILILDLNAVAQDPADPP
jgi:hypothetical protein